MFRSGDWWRISCVSVLLFNDLHELHDISNIEKLIHTLNLLTKRDLGILIIFKRDHLDQLR
jgi:hypothetical protein